MYLSQGTTNRIIDTLRISEREAVDILDALNGSQHDLPTVELRDSDRLACRPNKGLVVQIQHPGGSSGLFLVWPRNISRTGMSFLHGNFIYPNTQIIVNLRKPNGPTVRVPGRIMRCRHVGGIVHEIGVKFEHAQEMAIIAQYSGSEQKLTGSTASAAGQVRLAGRVLVIDDCIDDRDLLGFICTNCGLECTEAAMLEEAQNYLQTQMYDLVLTDVQLNDGAMDQIVEGLRVARFPGPVIGIWQAANNSIDPSLLEQAGFSELLNKPVNMEKATQMLAKYLPKAGNGRDRSEALLSEQWNNEQMRPLILAFLGRLDTQMKRLEAMTQREPGTDVDYTLMKLLMDLHGTSGSFGFPTISDAAMELYRLAGSESTDDNQLRMQVNRLTALVRSACAVRQRSLGK